MEAPPPLASAGHQPTLFRAENPSDQPDRSRVTLSSKNVLKGVRSPERVRSFVHMVAWLTAGIAIALGSIAERTSLRWPLPPAPPNDPARHVVKFSPPTLGHEHVTVGTPLSASVVPGSVGGLSLGIAMFGDVKLLIVSEGRTNNWDVQLTLAADALLAARPRDMEPLVRLPYDRIGKATYVRAKDPLWDQKLAAPGEKINAPGFMGRSRRWLVVQTSNTYAILRLDGEDWLEVLRTFETRSGISIDRPLPNGHVSEDS
jgi:hypothetical protein